MSGQPQGDKQSDDKADEALKARVAGEAPPPDSVTILTPEEAQQAKTRRHPRLKPPEENEKK